MEINESKFKLSIEDSLNASIKTYNEIKPSEKILKKFVNQFGNIENPFDFMHGYFMGELQGIAVSTAQCKLGRDMNKEEIENIAKIIKSKSVIVEEIIKNIKKINSQKGGFSVF